jgi:hypothetical protein
MSEDSLPVVKVSFRLRGASFDPDEVTRRLGLEPTDAYRAGEPISRRGLGKHREDGWAIQIGPRETLEIAPMLRELRDLVGVEPEKLREVCTDLGLRAVIYIPIEPTSSQAPSAEIPEDIIAWAAEFGASIDVDLLLWSLHIVPPDEDEE